MYPAGPGQNPVTAVENRQPAAWKAKWSSTACESRRFGMQKTGKYREARMGSRVAGILSMYLQNGG